MKLQKDPKLVEEFLLTQDDIFDASGWLSEGLIHVHVTTYQEKVLTETELISLCRAGLGRNHVPAQIQIFQRLERA